MIKDKIKAKIRESVLGIPVEVEKSLTFNHIESISEVKKLKEEVKKLKEEIDKLQRENQFLRTENEKLKERVGYEEPVRCPECGFTAVYPLFIQTLDSVKRIGYACLRCKKFYGD